MAVTPRMYGLFLESLVEGRINVRSDPMFCMLVTSAYVFSQHFHKYKSVITGEVVGSGYGSGGQEVTGLTPDYDSATKTLRLPAGNLNWPAVTFTGVVGGVLYMKPDGFPTNAMPLVAYLDFGMTVNKAGEAFYVNWAATGATKLAVP
jgi:hypothetical protein